VNRSPTELINKSYKTFLNHHIYIMVLQVMTL